MYGFNLKQGRGCLVRKFYTKNATKLEFFNAFKNDYTPSSH